MEPSIKDTAPLRALQVLLLEDSQADARLLLHELQRAGFEPQWQRVETEADYCAALHSGLDVILADYSLPQFNAIGALQLLQQSGFTVPLIVVTGAVGEEQAAECIKSGAYDYLLKDRLGRLGLAIEQALERRHINVIAQLRSELADMIVHDLRTPLTSLLSGLQMMDVLGELNEEQREVLHISLDGGLVMLQMINDLLDVSKSENGALNLQYSLFSVADLVANAVQQVRGLVHYKRLDLEVNVPDDLPQLYADADKLLRTLVNLLSNATKFAYENGRVSIAATVEEVPGHQPDRAILFRVTDTGEGIPREEFGRIFEKFGQVAARRAGHKMSSGLGLTFCRMAVEAHRGRIWVESQVGHGSTFSFTIPLSIRE